MVCIMAIIKIIIISRVVWVGHWHENMVSKARLVVLSRLFDRNKASRKLRRPSLNIPSVSGHSRLHCKHSMKAAAASSTKVHQKRSQG